MSPKESKATMLKSAKLRIVGFVGGYLIDDGVLTLEELDRGLAEQLQRAVDGEEVGLGQVLIDLGFITPTQLERALKRMAHDQEALKHPAGSMKHDGAHAKKRRA